MTQAETARPRAVVLIKRTACDGRVATIGVVTITPELAALNRAAIRVCGMDAICEGATSLILDLSTIGYLDSIDLRSIVQLYHRVRNRGGRVILVGLNEDLRTLLELTKLDSILPTATDVATAEALALERHDEQLAGAR